MSDSFLSNFMRAAQTITRAERCLALDADKIIQDRLNVSDELLATERFTDLLYRSVDEALESSDAVITNNLIQDPQDAPNTNVHLHDLRMILALPLAEHGAIYLDQQIRQGVFERDMVAKLANLGQKLVAENKTNLDSEAIVALYQEA
jgi:hypothetical protein